MHEYQGADNLEVMQEAKIYNAYLTKIVQSHAYSGCRILDFGAGIGTFSIPLKLAGYSVACVEADPRQLEKITAYGIEGYMNLIDVPDASFDYIFSLNVLEHIEQDSEVLGMLARKLKPEGSLLIYVPAFPILYSSMDRTVGHVRRYKLLELAMKMSGAGFEIAEKRYVDSIGFIAAFIFKHFGNSSGRLSKTAVILFDRFAFPISRGIDMFTKRLFGKNLLMVGRLSPPASGATLTARDSLTHL